MNIIFIITGRETFMAPVRWIDGWPVINPDFDEVQYAYPIPNLKIDRSQAFPLNVNFVLKDDSDSEKLALYWIFLRTVREKWYSLEQNPGNLRIQLRQYELWEKQNPSFIGRRQQHLNFSVSTALSFTPKSENETTGIVAFQNESHYYYLGKTIFENKQVVRLEKSGNPLNYGNARWVPDTIHMSKDEHIYQSERWGGELNYSIPEKLGMNMLSH